MGLTSQEIMEEVYFPFLNKKINFSEYHKFAEPSIKSKLALNGVREVSPTISKWKNHLPRVKQQMLLHGDISKSLITFGYEKNDSWISILDDVENIKYESFWEEYFTKKDLFKRQLIGYKAVFNHFAYDNFGFDYKNLKRKIKNLWLK